MTTWTLKVASFAALMLAMVAPGAAASRKTSPNKNNTNPGAPLARVVENYGNLPLSFEENRGQADADVKFVAHGTSQTLSLNSKGAVLSLRKRPARNGSLTARSAKGSTSENVSVQMTLASSNLSPRIEGLDKLPGVANYYIGLKESKSQTGIPTYAKVRFAEVYPGIDLDYHGNNRQLEYDFVVRSGANPQNIRLAFDGVQGLELDRSGNLILHAPGGDLLQHKPIAYQEIGGLRQEVPAQFVLAAHNEVSFELGVYDRTRTLVVDPTVTLSSSNTAIATVLQT